MSQIEWSDILNDVCSLVHRFETEGEVINPNPVSLCFNHVELSCLGTAQNVHPICLCLFKCMRCDISQLHVVALEHHLHVRPATWALLQIIPRNGVTLCGYRMPSNPKARPAAQVVIDPLVKKSLHRLPKDYPRA